MNVLISLEKRNELLEQINLFKLNLIKQEITIPEVLKKLHASQDDIKAVCLFSTYRNEREVLIEFNKIDNTPFIDFMYKLVSQFEHIIDKRFRYTTLGKKRLFVDITIAKKETYLIIP